MHNNFFQKGLLLCITGNPANMAASKASFKCFRVFAEVSIYVALIFAAKALASASVTTCSPRVCNQERNDKCPYKTR